MFLTEPFPNIHSLSLFLVMATEDMSMFVAVRTLVKCNYYPSLKSCHVGSHSYGLDGKKQ